MKTWLLLALLTVAGVGYAEGSSSGVVQRHDNSDPLLNLVIQQSVDLQALKAKVSAISSLMDDLKLQVGFSVTLGNNLMFNADRQTVKFDRVHYNQGMAYDSHTGYFTAPVSGMYTFSLKSEVDADHEVRLVVVKEGREVLYIYGRDRDSYQTPGAQVVLHLNKDQRVWVATKGSNKNQVRVWTRFGGFLVKPDP